MALTLSFKDKRVLVTGTGSGIGRALSIRLHADGATVYAVSKSAERLASLASECPGIHTICVDLGDWDATREALKDLPVMDCLVNNAGIVIEATFSETTSEIFDEQMNINVKSVINVSQLVVAKMLEAKTPGSIVNVSSMASRTNMRTSISYAMSKSVLDMLTKGMAVELGPRGIRVNSVNPGIIMTALGKKFYEKEPGLSVLKYVVNRTPMRKVCETDEVVNTILFLLSDATTMIHGEMVFIDGAFTAT